MKRFVTLAVLLSFAWWAEARENVHWISIGVLNPEYATSTPSGARATGGVSLSYSYDRSPQWSLVLSAGAQRDREIVNLFVGREGCICNSHYRDFEVLVRSYSGGAVVQREFSISKRWAAYSGAGIGYFRGPGSMSGRRFYPLPSSSGRELAYISFKPQVAERAVAGLAFRARPRAKVVLEVARAFGVEDTLVNYSQPSVALRVSFAVR
jgi:hypothetical protein